MTEAEVIARARETAAFLAGWRYSSEAMLQGLHDPLVGVVATLHAAMRVRVELDSDFDQLAAWRALDELHEQAVAAFAAGRRVADEGALPALTVFELLEVDRGTS
jgi:hypothetical protein